MLTKILSTSLSNQLIIQHYVDATNSVCAPGRPCYTSYYMTNSQTPAPKNHKSEVGGHRAGPTSIKMWTRSCSADSSRTNKEAPSPSDISIVIPTPPYHNQQTFGWILPFRYEASRFETMALTLKRPLFFTVPGCQDGWPKGDVDHSTLVFRPMTWRD